MKLFRSMRYRNCWFAFSRELGWVTFPAEVAGWQKREPAPDAHRIDMREVPLHMGFNTGIPGAPMPADGTVASPRPLRRVASAIPRRWAAS